MSHPSPPARHLHQSREQDTVHHRLERPISPVEKGRSLTGWEGDDFPQVGDDVLSVPEKKKAGNGDDGNVVEKQRRVSRRRHRFHGAPGRRLPNPPPDRRIPYHPRADMLHEPLGKEGGQGPFTGGFHGGQTFEDTSVETYTFPAGPGRGQRCRE